MFPDQPQQMQPRQVTTTNPDRQMCIVRVSPCGQYVVGGGYDASVRRWQLNDDGFGDFPTLTGHHGWVQAMAFHPDRRRLITADSWGEIRIWPYTDREARPQHTIANAHDGWIRDIAVNGNGEMFATCSRDQKVSLWDINGRKIRDLTGHNEDVFCLAFHPDNRTLVSGDLKGNVFQWNIATGQRTRTFDCTGLYTLSRLQDVGGVRRLVFDAQGRTLACAGTTPRNGGNVQGTPTIHLFNWQSGERTHTLNVGNQGDGYVYDLAFHADGYVMAVSSGNPGTGKFYFHRPGEDAPFFLHTRMANCHSMSVHPDGNRLVVSATNSGSNGNGRRLQNGEYAGNFSPLYLWEIAS